MAHLIEEETLTGREALQTLDDFVDCDALNEVDDVPRFAGC